MPALRLGECPWDLTALFKDTRILKFKSQLMFAFFAVVNHLIVDLLGNRGLLQQVQKVMVQFVIGRVRSVLCVSVYQCSLLGIVIMINGNKKSDCEGSF